MPLSKDDIAEPGTLPALSIIRTETALSRYPIHRMSKRGNVNIEISRQSDTGATVFLWEVSYNSRYGQPGPLAYKLDTLIVNRRIEEAGRPVPRVLRLGSLSEIARALDLGGNTGEIRKALRQNASAFITAKMTYKGQDKSEYHVDLSDTRYGVVFTGEKLPDGQRADAVYIVLHEPYQEILNRAVRRPLDYDYLKELTPSAQRFYEIVSYQMYATLLHGLPRARLAYSEFCLYSTLTRHFDYDRVKKQMYKVHRPHIVSEYLDRVEFEAVTDQEGRPDWIMWYTPGAKAKLEYQTFGQRRKSSRVQASLFPPEEMGPSPEDWEEAVLLSLVDGQEAVSPSSDGRDEATPAPPVKDPLVSELVSHGLNHADAARFAKEKPEECRRQLDYLPYVSEFKKGKARYLHAAIRDRYGPPERYAEQQAMRRIEEGERERVGREKVRKRHEETHSGAYLSYVAQREGEVKEGHPEAYLAFVGREEKARTSVARLKSDRLLKAWEAEDARLERFRAAFPEDVLDFWAWDRRLNPEPFEDKKQ